MTTKPITITVIVTSSITKRALLAARWMSSCQRTTRSLQKTARR